MKLGTFPKSMEKENACSNFLDFPIRYFIQIDYLILPGMFPKVIKAKYWDIKKQIFFFLFKARFLKNELGLEINRISKFIISRIIHLIQEVFCY